MGFFCLVFVMPLYASVYTCMCLVVNDWERASWLSFVVSNCEFVTFPLVSFVRCGTCLFRFLIFAPLLTFIYLELNVPQQTLVNLQVISNHIRHFSVTADLRICTV